MAIQPPFPQILIHGQIPKPMHGVAPREIKGKEWWDVQRKAAYKKHQFHCWACGTHKLKAKYHRWLEAHERYAIDYERGRMTFLGCVALCHACHNFIHSGRLEALVEKGEMDPKFRDEILRHGSTLMKKYGLEYPPEPENSAPWERWRLVLDGEEYRPKFPSYDSWLRHFYPAQFQTT